jgi:hypothetical protein
MVVTPGTQYENVPLGFVADLATDRISRKDNRLLPLIQRLGDVEIAQPLLELGNE